MPQRRAATATTARATVNSESPSNIVVVAVCQAPKVLTLPSTFGEGPTALFTVTLPTFSTRFSVILLCMAATGTQLMMRSCPYVAALTEVCPAARAPARGWLRSSRLHAQQ